MVDVACRILVVKAAKISNDKERGVEPGEYRKYAKDNGRYPKVTELLDCKITRKERDEQKGHSLVCANG